ncbi:MAG TPA: SAM-dependent methyltransferase [bacterium]|nr:SAM-dependent methyltransferase [bacterium]
MGGVNTASFRDPSGFVFERGGILYRQVNSRYAPDYDLIKSSGLLDELQSGGMLVAHKEADLSLALMPESAYKIIEPEKIPFISYPYEWSFSMLKDAALLTLEIHKRAVNRGMSLKDASAYNIQFKGSRPVFIDTLSFEKYKDGEPWIAYGQFCSHFLAPLALMALRDIRLSSLLRAYIDGIPLDLASKLLPFLTRLNIPLLTNIHMHARSRLRYGGKGIKKSEVKGKISKFGMLAIIDGLETAVKELKWQPRGTQWGGYYNDTNYTAEAFENKEKIVKNMIEETGVKSGLVWDLGANEGVFSSIAASNGHYTAAFDIDPAAVEKNYIRLKHDDNNRIIPLLMDLTNPSAASGFGNEERMSMKERGPADIVLALALIHHLAISNNTPLSKAAGFFAASGRNLIVEFVPKEDSQARRLLAFREDIFEGYTTEGFERGFKNMFEIIRKEPIQGTKRVLYLMRRL